MGNLLSKDRLINTFVLLNFNHIIPSRVGASGCITSTFCVEQAKHNIVPVGMLDTCPFFGKCFLLLSKHTIGALNRLVGLLANAGDGGKYFIKQADTNSFGVLCVFTAFHLLANHAWTLTRSFARKSGLLEKFLFLVFLAG
jgi:hypothetical protein